MQKYQENFIHTARTCGALRFGEFTLKSGRVSPYFFNAGAISSGAALAVLGESYAAAIADSGIAFDMLFGPAYKGIPLAASTAIALANVHGRDVPFAFNRKEAKAHGEGGRVVGAPISGRVLIIDDVITAGTAIRESLALIAEQGGQCVGVVIGLDREERGEGSLSAVQELEQRYGLPVVSIVSLSHIVAHLGLHGGDMDILERIEAYRNRYGISRA